MNKNSWSNDSWLQSRGVSFMMEAEIKLNAGVLMWMTQRFGFQFQLQQCFTGADFYLTSFLALMECVDHVASWESYVGEYAGLVLGTGHSDFAIFRQSVGSHVPQPVSYFLTVFPNLVIFYLGFWFYNYLTMLTIYQFNWPRLRQDYIIVLGAGLLDGDRVSPLLGQRIWTNVK